MKSIWKVSVSGSICTYTNIFPSEKMAKEYANKKSEYYNRRDITVEELVLPVKVKEIGELEYEHQYDLDTKDGSDVYWHMRSKAHDNRWDVFAETDILDFKFDNEKILPHHVFVIDVTNEEAKQFGNNYLEAKKEERRRSVDKYLNSPFAKGWLNKMRYTERVDKYGNKFLFIAIKCGYEKISQKAFQKLCDAICMRAYGDSLRMTMWIGGKVNWTMFYQRPDHVNGHETYFCGVVGEDDFSPEDWDRDHSEYSFENADRY